MRDLLTDVRYAARQLRHTPGFTLTAILTLALGIAANTTVFAIVNGVVFKLTSGMSLERVTTSWAIQDNGRRGTGPFAGGTPLLADVDRLRALAAQPPPGVERVAGLTHQSVNIRRPGRVERARVELVSGDYAALLGLGTRAGRWLTREDDRPGSPSPVAVVSDRFLRDWLGGDVKAVGSGTIAIAGRTFTVVGVAAPGFAGFVSPLAPPVDVWVPLGSPILGARQPVASTADLLVRWRDRIPPVDAARPQLEPLVTEALALREQGLRAQDRRYHIPPDDRRYQLAFAIDPARSTLAHDLAERWGWILLAMVGVVLVAACANFANLLHARGARRVGELAVRLSLGASRWRVLRLLAAESLLLAVLASAAGLALAVLATGLLARAFPALDFVRREPATSVDVSADWRVIAFAFGSGVLATLVVGVLAAWRASRAPLQAVMSSSGAAGGQTTGRRARWIRTALVAVQVTVAVVLVIASATFVESLLTSLESQGLRGREVHFDTARIVAGQVQLRLDLGDDYNEPRGRQFFDQALQAIGRLPGVEAAGLADAVPGALGSGAPGSGYLSIAPTADGLSGDVRRAAASYVRVSPGFLRLLDLPLVRGRDIGPNDVAGAPMVAVVSESAAEALWPGRDPIGREILYGKDAVTVVGVAADPVTAFDDSPWRRPANMVFLPFAQHFQGSAYLMLRSPSAPAQVEAMRATVAAVNDRVAVMSAGVLSDAILAWTAAMRAFVTVLSLLGAVALAISMLGVYGVIAFFVSSRTREIGIRSALGATPGRVRKLVIDEAVHIVLIGLLCGVLVASLGSRVALVMARNMMPNGLTAWVVVPILMLACGVLAGYLPARRAARIDPNVALREL
jgi:putative ABC transport system permease protein